MNTELDRIGQRLTDVAWVAGLIDGEGYIALRSSPIIEVESVCPSLVNTPARIFGGRVSSRVRKGTRVYRWRAYGSDALNILQEVLPFLRYKAAQAVIVKDATRYPPKSAMRESSLRRLLQLRKLRY